MVLEMFMLGLGVDVSAYVYGHSEYLVASHEVLSRFTA